MDARRQNSINLLELSCLPEIVNVEVSAAWTEAVLVVALSIHQKCRLFVGIAKDCSEMAARKRD